MKRYLVILVILFFYRVILFSIEVSGHISTDTVWSPENNPYLVVDNIFIDENVTLTIEPGTIVKFNTADKDGGDFYYDNGYTEAKFMLVRGKLAAVGTKQDSIIFTRNSYEVGQRWGSIIFMPESDSTSILKHCKFEYSYFIRLVLGGAYYQGAVSFLNSKVTITECLFNKYLFGISCYDYSSPLIYKNRFTTDPGDEDSECYRAIDLWHAYPIIFYNVFDNERTGIIFGYPYTDLQIPVAYNTFINSSNGIISDEGNIYIYKNSFYNCNLSIDTYNDIAIIKENNIEGGGGIEADGTITITENIITNVGGAILTWDYSNCIISNNILTNNGTGIHNYYNTSIISNNLIINNDNYGIKCSGYDLAPLIINNIIANCYRGIRSKADSYIINNIFYNIEDYIISYHYAQGVNFSVGNCCLPDSIEDDYIDLGGNIIADPIFVDPENGDFHLLPISPCIDTGTPDTSGYFIPPFDLDYAFRIWDGDNNGEAIIDMGCYEFGAMYIGGIAGQVTLNNGDGFVPLTRIEIDGEIAYPDTNGYYDVNLLPGVYEITATLEGYDDVIISDIEILEGEVTILNFEMNSNVGVDDNIVSEVSGFELSNYPNPVVNSTNISFSLPKNTKEAEIRIYNIKGQLVKQFKMQKAKGKMNILWDGKDDSGKPVANGIYFYKLSANNKNFIKKMIVLK